jgi:hypothetical protein
LIRVALVDGYHRRAIAHFPRWGARRMPEMRHKSLRDLPTERKTSAGGISISQSECVAHLQ